MYSYVWDETTGGLLLTSTPLAFSKEPRPVYYKELDILGFDKHWRYEKNDAYPYMWAEANNYWYRGRKVAQTKGGSLYTAPEIVLLEDPEPDSAPLRFVDIPAMVAQNRDIMEMLVQDTIKKVFNTYVTYKNKVDIFHVSYSGGKDSEVTLDIVQSALPHSCFVVVFGNTGMEFPDTYKAVEKAKRRCEDMGIQFYEARSHLSPIESWSIFGSPSKTLRWCCSVHKTAPQLLLLRTILGKSDFREMAFVGIRGDESIRRSEYDYISLGTKHKGQYSCNPILEWSSAEVYLYLYSRDLTINNAYKKGNNRAGCLVCPMSGDSSDYMRSACYPSESRCYTDLIKNMHVPSETKSEDGRYIAKGDWKARVNGRDIRTLPEKYKENFVQNGWELEVINPSTDWREWIKTIGTYLEQNYGYIVEKDGTRIPFDIYYTNRGYKVRFISENGKSALLTKMLKQTFRKSAYCSLCRACEADCQRGCISMKGGVLRISDDCVHCSNCHKPDTGCLLYKSINLPKGNGKMNNNSIDSYADHAPKLEWIESFFSLRNEFFNKHALGSEMISKFKRFLRDAELIENNFLTPTSEVIARIGLNSSSSWSILLVNLSYSPEVKWFIKRTKPYMTYSREQLMEMLKDDGVKDRGAKSITGAYKRILSLPLGRDSGLGTVEQTGKDVAYTRGSWQSPDPRVILYALYKFAEACGDYYSFTLTRLLNHDIDSDGVSPTEIFGLGRDEMEKLLNGLSINHPEFINASFTHDLDNITLRSDRSSKNVLDLF